MIIPDRKKAVTMILGRMGDNSPVKPEVKPESEIDEADGALKSIAEDLISALANKSAHGVMQALKAFMAEIEARDEEQDEQDEME